MVSAVASVLVNATGPKAGDPLSYTTGRDHSAPVGVIALDPMCPMLGWRDVEGGGRAPRMN